MALSNPINPPTDTLPTQIVKAALHRAEQPVWWLHGVFARIAHAATMAVWLMRCVRPVWSMVADRTDDALVARFPILTGRKEHR